MNLFKAWNDIFGNVVRSTDDIVEDLHLKVKELSARAEQDAISIEKNKQRIAEIEQENAVVNKSRERAERVASKINDLLS